MDLSRGKFIVVEGIDGCGKGSAVAAIKKRFPNFITSREPGGTPLAEAQRNILLSPIGSMMTAEQQMDTFMCARRIHLIDKVYPALLEGISVITDRFDASTFAYQKVLTTFDECHDDINQVLFDKFFQLREVVVTRKPDMYIFLDVDEEEGMRRRALDRNQESNHFDLASIVEQKRRRRAYQIFFSRTEDSYTRYVTIDANQQKHRVAQDVLTEVQSLF